MKRSPNVRTWIFRLLTAVVVPVILLAAAEGILRLVGFGHPTRFFLPDEIGARGVYRDNPSFSWIFFDPENARYPQPFTMERPPPDDSLRVLVLGGSAAAGDPGPGFGFARMLEVMLRDRFPGREVEVVNAAMTAVNSHVMRRVALELKTVRPDVVVVYMGNNEVVGPYGPATVLRDFSPSLGRIRAGIRTRATRLGQAALSLRRTVDPSMSVRPKWEGMRLFLETQIAWGDPVLESTYTAYERNLEDIVQFARRAGAGVLVCTLAVNLRDAPPFASAHAEVLAPDRQAAWQETFRAGVAAEAMGDRAGARTHFAEALDIDDQYAESYYRLARCLEPGAPSVAVHYQAAVDRDTLRFRADSRINEIVRGLAAANTDRGVRMVDVEAMIADHSPGGVPGAAHFVDHVHFTFDANYLVASNLLVHLLPMLGVPAGESQAAMASPERCAERLAWTLWDQHRIGTKMIQRLMQPPFTNQLDHQQRLQETAARVEALRPAEGFGSPESVARYRAAFEARPLDWRLRVNGGEMLVAVQRAGEALVPLREAVDLAPHRVESLAHFTIALAAAGRGPEGLAFFGEMTEAMEPHPDRVMFLFRVGMDLIDLGYLGEAIAWFDGLIQVFPGVAEVHNALGGALLMGGRAVDAERHVRRALELTPQYPEALNNLGTMVAQKGDVSGALRYFEQAMNMDPRHTGAQDNAARAHQLLGQTCLQDGRSAEAVVHFRKAVALRPAWPEPANTLVQILTTHPDSGIRDVAEAVALGETVCAATGYGEVGPLVNLALAYSAAGQDEAARRTGELALARANDSGDTGLVAAVMSKLGRVARR